MIALLLALYLHRSAPLVELVYSAGGIDAVSLVECESQFFPQALRVEPRGHTSWGLFQIDNEWHEQYRYDLAAHIAEGERILRGADHGRGFADTVAHYNGGKYPSAAAWAWGRTVAAKRGELMRVVWTQVYKGG